ncbi:MAG TPA: hypothetical protein VGN90_00605 [Pyrinomonadaceae bacterium]|jgi:hypothetical protein|nr:hypothetical protein [Pyrinomonadaceae bacterium]
MGKIFAVLIVGCLVLAVAQCGSGMGKPASQSLSPEQQQLAAQMKDVTKKYLVEKLGGTGFGGKAFCAYKVLDIEQTGADVNEYVYAVCQEYYDKNGVLTKGTGSGLPVALLLHKQADGYQVVSHRVPGDGSRYSRDVEQIFPKRTHAEIFAAGSDYTSWKEEVESEARKFFGK